MAGSRKKPGKIPDYVVMGDLDPVSCVWYCSGCGAPAFFPQDKGKHGGPATRSPLDPRYSAPITGPCWRSKEYGLKCVTPKGTRVLMHEGAPNPMQPDQPDAENIATIVATRGGRRKDNRDQAKGGQNA